MHYCPQFLCTLMLMLIIFQFGFSMERPPRKSILNPDAAAFVPHLPFPEYRQTHQHQANQNPPQFQPPIHQSPRKSSPEFPHQPHSIPNTDTKYHPLPHFPNLNEFIPQSSNPHIASEELDEHEALSLLPNFMQDEYGQKKDAFSDNVSQRKEVCSSQETRLEQKKEMKEKHQDDQEKKENFRAVQKDVPSSTKLDTTFMAAKSSPSYNKRKEKQEHSQKQVKKQDKKQQEQRKQLNSGREKSSPHSDSGSILPSYFSTHKHQSPKVEKKPALVISPRTLKKTPESTSQTINVSNTSKFDLLAREELIDPTESEQQKEKQLLVYEEEEEIAEKSVDKHKEQSESESRNQQGSWQRQTAKSKGKSAVINTKEAKKSQKEKEKEEAKLLREEMKKAAKERWEQDQLRKQQLDYRIGEHKKKMEELSHSGDQLKTLPTESTTANVQRHGEGSGSGSGHKIKGESLTILPVPTSYKIAEESNKSAIDVETELLLHNKSETERRKKSKQIKDILKKLQAKINEIEKFEKELKEEEKNWFLNEIKKFVVDIAKRNGKENEIHDIEKMTVKELLGKINIYITKKEKEIFFNLETYINLDNAIEIQKVKLAKLENEYEGLNENKKNWNKKKMEKKLKLLEIKLSNQKKNFDIFEKEMEKTEKLLMEEFIKMNNNEEPETEKMKEILGKMNEPLTYLWTAYNLVLVILNQHWKQPYIKNHFKLKRPYHFISSIFGITICEKDCGEDKEEFNKTMQLTLKKMLIHRNTYRNLNLIINGVSVHEKLNCFDELSGKISWLAEECKKTKIAENHGERMEIFGKFFKEDLNKTFHDVFHFNMVGLDKLPDLWDQMVLEGIGRLSNWLPKEWQRQFNEIWLELYEYFEEEKQNLKWLTFEDEVAEVVLDLFPEYANKRFKKQLKNIDDLYNRMDESVKFSNDVKNFMLDAFDHITAWIRSTNILLKIVKRKEHALLYLTSVYDKYYYMVSGMRFREDFLLVRQYHFYKEKNQAAIDLMEEIVSQKLDIRAEIKPIFDQIKQNEPSILNEMMEVIEAIDEVVAENGIIDRAVNFESDEDFMKSIAEESPNKSEYEYRKNMFT